MASAGPEAMQHGFMAVLVDLEDGSVVVGASAKRGAEDFASATAGTSRRRAAIS